MSGFVLLHLPGRTLVNVSGDTTVMVHGARTIAYCLSHGIDSNCDRVPPGVGPFPLFQYLPVLLFTQLLSMGDVSVYKALTIISALSFCGVIGLGGWAASRTGRRSAPAITVLILTASPLVYYAWSTFGEMLAALLVMLLAVAALRRWSAAAVALTAFLACITKETVFPIVAIVGAVSLWATPIGLRPLRRGHWIGLACGVLLGIAVSAAFNWFRYDQLTNSSYFSPGLQVPGLARRLGLSVTLWLAPNAGTAVFWPLATALIVGLMAIAANGWTRRPVVWSRTAPALGLVVAVLILTGTLASWYSPFGWYSWGPRLMLPIIPAIVVIGVVIYSAEVERAVRFLLGRPVRTGVVAVAAIALALPQVNVLNRSVVSAEIFVSDKTCPTMPIIQVSPSYWYRCLDHRAWAVHWILPDSYRGDERAWGAIFAVTFAGLWGWLLWDAARPRAARSGPKRSRGGASVLSGVADAS